MYGTLDLGKVVRGLAVAATFVFAAGCADSSVDGQNTTPPVTQAFLSVVGDRNVFLESGARQTLTVKYHDQVGQPLAGSVSFAFDGEPAGSILTKSVAVTDADGMVRVELLGGIQAETSFRIVAEAEAASPADWRVAVAKPLPPFTVAGRYSVESHFELIGGLPGGAGGILSTFIDMTDDPADPASWLIDRAMDEADLGPFEFLIASQRPGLDWNLNQIILERSPSFVTSLIQIGDRLSQITRRFGLLSDLTIGAQNGPEQAAFAATHAITGVILSLDGTDYRYNATDLTLDSSTVSNVPISLEGESKVSIGDHTLPFDYGKILLFALDNIVIPTVDPWARSTADFLRDQIDCHAVGVELEYDTGAPAGLFELGCRAALAAAAKEIEEGLLEAFGAPTTMVIHGDARPVDANADRTVDELQNGQWEGMLRFGTLSSALPRPDQRFLGQRSGVK